VVKSKRRDRVAIKKRGEAEHNHSSEHGDTIDTASRSAGASQSIIHFDLLASDLPLITTAYPPHPLSHRISSLNSLLTSLGPIECALLRLPGGMRISSQTGVAVTKAMQRSATTSTAMPSSRIRRCYPLHCQSRPVKCHEPRSATRDASTPSPRSAAKYAPSSCLFTGTRAPSTSSSLISRPTSTSFVHLPSIP
jgi:hypothetical protein